ncbi:MAG: 4Fe-4S dicluster domain-containing protein [Bacteroidota bacterium]
MAAGCDIPIKRAIPYVVKPDEIVPGVATYYASSFVRGGDYCSVLVKTREGRPIKIEGNSLSPVSMGGTSARAQAVVLSLYDVNRVQSSGTVVEGKLKKGTWEELDKNVQTALNSASQIRIVCNTVLSPTTKAVFAEFVQKYPGTKIVTYDPISSSALLEANALSFGEQMIPDYHFDKADVIVSFGADFLGTWISGDEYSVRYVKGRTVKNLKKAKISRHIQVESGMSMTGSNADNRIMVRPSEMGAAIAVLYNEIARQVGATIIDAPKLNDRAIAGLKRVASELVNARGKSLIVSGSNNVGEQVLVNKMNDLLGNLGNTLQFAHVSHQRQGIDGQIQDLIKEMSGGGIDLVMVYGEANPAYDLWNAEQFKTAFAKVKTRISFCGDFNETSALCTHIAPNHHLLESWGDAEPKSGNYSLIQPTISPLFDTRQTEESLLLWAGSANLDSKADQPYYEYLKMSWRKRLETDPSISTSFQSFRAFWDNALHDGVINMDVAAKPVEHCVADLSLAASMIEAPSNAELEIEFYESVAMGAGQYANNPWLQELPDPVTRCTWGNYLGVPVQFDGVRTFEGYKGVGANLGKGYADVVDLKIGETSTKITAFPQFGQTEGTVSTALGYGRNIVGDSGKNVGVNMFPFLSADKNGNTRYYATNADLVDILEPDYEFPCVQYHHTLGVTAKDSKSGETINADEAATVTVTLGLFQQGYQGSLTDRSIIHHANVKEVAKYADKLQEKRVHFNRDLNDQSLYPGHDYNYETGHHWGMYVDLNACTGCAACVVSCIAENNTPVVGKTEVARHHEMTWLRIDRYFYGSAENPRAIYQPMMCQHCDNAPCENVCPVAATNHSSEGLNQMAYNRCVGTRYCANNCPYKVRRFNWLDYTTADIFPGNQYTINGEQIPYGADNLTRMVLNPDVTVRARGVIEKCSFCVQRIQEGKLLAKREGRKLRDTDVKPACQTACPTGAIVFGDMNNKKGELNHKIHTDLAYRVLEEINVDSSVYYSAKIHNHDEAFDA